MKGGRDDDKAMGPLFPRLHVHDADKGGLRAPPRNKMALYELFSIPSQRFNLEAASTLPPPPQHAASLVPSAMSGQGYGHVLTVPSPYCVPPHIPVHAEDNVHMQSMEGTNQNAMRMGLERKLLKLDSQRRVSIAGNVQAVVERSSLHQNDVVSIKNSSGKKCRDKDNFSGPICVQPGISLCSDKDHCSMDRERRTHFPLSSLQKNRATALSSLSQVKGSHAKPFKQCSSNVLMTWQFERSSERQARETVTQHEKVEVSMSHPSIREIAAEPSNICKPSSNLEHPCCKLSNLGSSQCGSARICQEYNDSFRNKRCLSNAEVMKKQVISNRRSRSCSKTSLDNISKASFDHNLVEPSVLEHCSTVGKKVAKAVKDAERTRSSVDADEIGLTGDANKNGKPEDADRHDDAFETSMVASLPGADISPDDVVGLIGPKHFWKVRRAMTNQQRVFAVQVFELHRLIKVQKLIAASPDLLLQDTCYLHNSPKAPGKDPSAPFWGNTQLKTFKQKNEYKVNNSESATEKTASADVLVKTQLQIVNASHKVDCDEACPTENATGILPVPHEHCKRPMSQLPRDGASSGRVSSFPATSGSKQGAWCIQPPGTQWLISVMSPSEGLIYKPWAGPCPPTVAFMAPGYIGCGPPNATPVDLTSTGVGVPRSHQQHNTVLPAAPAIAPSYFPAPHGLPVVNPVISASPVEHLTPVAGPRSSGRIEQALRSPCNMPNPKSEAFSGRARKVHIPEDGDSQGSTASCPGDDDAGRDALPLFPMTESAECSGCPPQAHGGDDGTRVIKAVPLNARSATESAARIFRSIQKERQQHNSA